MSCEIPCVATNIVDIELLIGDTGKIVAPKDPKALAAAISDLLSLNTQEMIQSKKRARQRIIDIFSLEVITEKYLSVYQGKSL